MSNLSVEKRSAFVCKEYGVSLFMVYYDFIFSVVFIQFVYCESKSVGDSVQWHVISVQSKIDMRRFRGRIYVFDEQDGTQVRPKGTFAAIGQKYEEAEFRLQTFCWRGMREGV